ncbi:hypothetical protein PCO82_05535 [Pectobacteriaceae bacterium CE90]|nr:hypothetical protein PCO82_05535 [Pectobacteriaceae bacterium CE90]
MRHDEKNMACRITALVSVGKHPGSGRVRRAEQDARAVEMGMTLAFNGLEVLHAGNPYDEALRSYAGMGISSLRVLSMEAQGDAVQVLSHYLKKKSSGRYPDWRAVRAGGVFRYVAFSPC